MQTIIEQLRNDFQKSGHSESFTEDARIRYNSLWAGSTHGVREVAVYLAGEDPLTGVPLPETQITWKYSAASIKGTSAPARYHGTFHLHYDAVLEDGTRVRDFIPPKAIELTVSSKRPKILYKVTQERFGFSKISFAGSNCLRRCDGRLWVRHNGKYQRIPKLDPENPVCYFPSQEDITVLADPCLPAPEKIKG